MAFKTGRLAVLAALQVRAVAFSTILIRTTVILAVQNAPQADCMNALSAGRAVPPVLVTFKA